MIGDEVIDGAVSAIGALDEIKKTLVAVGRMRGILFSSTGQEVQNALATIKQLKQHVVEADKDPFNGMPPRDYRVFGAPHQLLCPVCKSASVVISGRCAALVDRSEVFVDFVEFEYNDECECQECGKIQTVEYFEAGWDEYRRGGDAEEKEVATA